MNTGYKKSLQASTYTATLKTYDFQSSELPERKYWLQFWFGKICRESESGQLDAPVVVEVKLGVVLIEGALLLLIDRFRGSALGQEAKLRVTSDQVVPEKKDWMSSVWCCWYPQTNMAEYFSIPGPILHRTNLCVQMWALSTRWQPCSQMKRLSAYSMFCIKKFEDIVFNSLPPM